MSNETQNTASCQTAVSGSKLERIAQTKKLIEEGKIFFNPILHENNKNLIIGCDFGSGKDESRKHIFYCR